MCGRFCNATNPDAVKATFKVHFALGDGGGVSGGGPRGHNAEPQWNIAPSLDVEVVTASSELNKNKLGLMRWGIATPQNTRPLINARSETMFEKPTFREAARQRRCLVVASGWYEWAAPKKPYFISRADAAPMGMAGLYWEYGEERHCVIVTTAAEGDLAELHHRAPLVLGEETMSRWLHAETPQSELMPIITPTAAEKFTWHPVSAEVGSTRVNHEGLTAEDPFHGAQPEPQLTLF